MPNISVLKSQTVIVSAFMTKINQRSDRDIQKYIDYGRKLVQVRIPKIVFIEKHTYDEVKHGSDVLNTFEIDDQTYEYVVQDDTLTVFVFFEKSMMYFYDYKHLITDFYLDTSNKQKDTVEYMFVQCFKTEWVRLAIGFVDGLANAHTHNRVLGLLCDFSENNQYIWMDFGLYHMFMNDDLFYQHLNGFHDRIESRFKVACANGHHFRTVYFASCWNHHHEYHLNIYTQIHWVFAGSVFGGYKDALLQFASFVREKCLQIIHEKRHLMWEINVWYLVYKVHPGLFDFYKCDHNSTIIAHY
jgi:hypothetical protein